MLFIVWLGCFAACARKEKAVLDLHVEQKVVEVKQDEIKFDDDEKKYIATSLPSSQSAPRKMSDNSEIVEMRDGFGNKLEKRYFKGHPRLDSVIIRTAPDGRREIIIYGQNGERKSVEGELLDRLMTASADEIANAAKLYGTRPALRNRAITSQTEQTKNQPPVSTSVTSPPQQPVTIQPNETTVEEPVQETPEKTDSTENSPPNPQKEEVKEDKENKIRLK
jgi:hypothetical protein